MANQVQVSKGGSCRRVQSISRAMAVLRLIGNNDLNGAALSDIVRLSNLPKGTVHRLLRSLEGEGMVVQHRDTQHYHIGPLPYELGLLSRRSPSELDSWAPILNQAASAIETTIHAVGRSGFDAICLRRFSGPAMQGAEFRFDAKRPAGTGKGRVGMRRPLGVGSAGVAILSQMQGEEANTALAHNERLYANYGGLSAGSVRQAVEKARDAGFTVRRCCNAAWSMAVPVMDSGSASAFALKATELKGELNTAKLRQLSSILTQAAAQLTRLPPNAAAD